MNLFENYLRKLDFIRHIEVYSGSQSIDDKTEALDKIRQPFNDEKQCDVILMQIKAGGVGINLQECDRIIFCSPWWTQAAIEQGIGRAVRIGQKNQVVVHNLVLKQEEDMGVRNIDRWMREKAAAKDGMNELALSYANSNLSLVE
jgi:SNF2 family DNA or RNA helicase